MPVFRFQNTHAALPQEKAAQLYTLLYELLNTLEK